MIGNFLTPEWLPFEKKKISRQVVLTSIVTRVAFKFIFEECF